MRRRKRPLSSLCVAGHHTAVAGDGAAAAAPAGCYGRAPLRWWYEGSLCCSVGYFHLGSALVEQGAWTP